MCRLPRWEREGDLVDVNAQGDRLFTPNDHEQALIRLCQAGDLHALEQLFTTHKDDVFRFACLVVRDHGLAQDVTQETFIKVFRSIRTFGFRASFKSWLYRVAVNESISLLRRRRLKEEHDGVFRTGPRQESQRDWQPEEAVLKDEMRHALRTALDRLDPLHRTVIILKYYQELSDSEIARVLRCPPGTIKSRLHRARELLKRGMAAHLGDLPQPAALFTLSVVRHPLPLSAAVGAATPEAKESINPGP